MSTSGSPERSQPSAPIKKDETLARYAEFAKITPELARRVRDEFFPKAMLWPDKVSGLDTLMPDAIAFKFLREPLTDAPLAELIRIPVVAR